MFQPDGPGLAELWEQALSSTRGGYDLIAPKFDATPFRTPDGLLAKVADHLRGGPPVARALDVCCGTGAGLHHLRNVADQAVGLDFSPGMLAEARRRLGPVDGHVHLVRGDAMAMPFEGVFDVATCFGAFGHIRCPEQPTFLRGIHRALRPGGRFVFVSGSPPGPTRRAFWIYRGFNLAMKIRNRLISPPFVMFYLNFTLPEALGRLVEAGFRPEVTPLGWAPRPELKLVVAHKDPTLTSR